MKCYVTWKWNSIWKYDNGSQELRQKIGPVFLDLHKCKKWCAKQDNSYYIEEVDLIE